MLWADWGRPPAQRTAATINTTALRLCSKCSPRNWPTRREAERDRREDRISATETFSYSCYDLLHYCLGRYEEVSSQTGAREQGIIPGHVRAARDPTCTWRVESFGVVATSDTSLHAQRPWQNRCDLDTRHRKRRKEYPNIGHPRVQQTRGVGHDGRSTPSLRNLKPPTTIGHECCAYPVGAEVPPSVLGDVIPTSSKSPRRRWSRFRCPSAAVGVGLVPRRVYLTREPWYTSRSSSLPRRGDRTGYRGEMSPSMRYRGRG